MTGLDHPTISKLAAALREAGLTSSADGIRVLDDDVRTAALAAQALGIEVGAIANSLIFRATFADGHEEPLLALTSGAHRADTDLLARLIGATTVGKANADFVRTHTGQPIGGVAPVGHPTAIRTVVDTHLANYPVVWAAAGHPKSLFPTTYAELCLLTGGTAANVSGEEEDSTP